VYYFCIKIAAKNMSQQTFNSDDERTNEVIRYENYIKGNGSGYFDVEEMETVIDFYLQRGNIRKCKKALDYGFKLHPESYSLTIKRAKIYLVMGRVKRAYNLLCSLGQIDDYEGIMLKIDLLQRLGNKKESYQLAKSIIDSCVEDEDDLDEVCLDLGFVFMDTMEFETALEFLLIGDNFNRQNIDLLFELGFCYEQLAHEDKAIATYKRIIEIDAFVSEAWFNLGQVYFSLDQFENAMKAYDYAITINENDIFAYLQKAHTHFQLQEYAQALQIYCDYENNALERWQSDLFAGECYEKLQQYDKAIELYIHSIDIEPNNCDAFTGMGICYLEKEMYLQAIFYFKKAIELDEKVPELWANIADAFMGLDDDENALLCYLKAINFDYQQPEVYVSIGNILLDRNEIKLALQYYLAAYEADNTLDKIELLIAIAYYLLGENSEAHLFLEKAVAVCADSQKLFFEFCPDAQQEEWTVAW
jgi:tetratricopeptide (TPR) repeat protein